MFFGSLLGLKGTVPITKKDKRLHPIFITSFVFFVFFVFLHARAKRVRLRREGFSPMPTNSGPRQRPRQGPEWGLGAR